MPETTTTTDRPYGFVAELLPAKDRTIRVPGHAGFDLQIERTLRQIGIKTIHENSAYVEGAGVHKVISALLALDAEVKMLDTRTASMPAVVACATCGEDMYVRAYVHGTRYYCKDTMNMKCFTEARG